jgi:2'-5' RNA ligase
VERPVLSVRRYRETERVAMLVLDDEGGSAGRLQARLSALLEQLGAYRPERRPWLAHVTVARFRERPRLRPALPLLEPFSPSDAALYHSVLRPDGAQYSILEAVSLD